MGYMNETTTTTHFTISYRLSNGEVFTTTIDLANAEYANQIAAEAEAAGWEVVQ